VGISTRCVRNAYGICANVSDGLVEFEIQALLADGHRRGQFRCRDRNGRDPDQMDLLVAVRLVSKLFFSLIAGI
jgi:hypothetical protein